MKTPTLPEDRILATVKQESTELSTALSEKGRQIKITDDATLKAAGSLVREIKNGIKTVKAAFSPHKTRAKEAHQGLVDAEKEQLAPFQEALKVIEPKILEYHDELDRIAEEKRLEADRKAKEEEDRLRAEAEKKKKEEAEKALAEGDPEKAEKVMSEPTRVRTQAPSAPVKTDKPKAAGAGVAAQWVAVLEDFAKVPDEFKQFNQSKANQYATDYKEAAKIPGIRFEKKKHLSGK